MQQHSIKLADLRKQLAKAEVAKKRHDQQAREAQQRIFAIERAIHAEEIRSIVGQQVKRRYRGSSNPQLNDAIGTLIEVRRTRCTVDFGTHGKWEFLISDILPLDQPQGRELGVIR